MLTGANDYTGGTTISSGVLAAGSTSAFGTGDVSGSSVRGVGLGGHSHLVVDEDRHVLVGATFTGADVQELLHSATVAIVGELTLDRLWHAVPTYPTVSEVWLRLLEAYGL